MYISQTMKFLKSANPNVLPNSSNPSRIRLNPMTPSNWVLYWGSRRTLGSFTTRNPTHRILKPRRVTSASKYFETGITSLFVADSRNRECASVNSLEDLLSNGRIFLIKYPSHTSVTMDPESSNDGTFQPKRSIGGIAGHCETALCITFCFVSEDTALLDNVQIMSSNLSMGIDVANGSPLAPFPWPLELGAFSLTYSQIDFDVTRKPSAFASADNCQHHDPCPCSNCKFSLDQSSHLCQLQRLVHVVYPKTYLTCLTWIESLAVHSWMWSEE